MHRSFSYTLLITWVLIFFACKIPVVLTSTNVRNIEVTEDINPVDSQLIHIYLPYKNILEKDMSRIISYSENEMIKAKPESSLTNFLADILFEEGTIEAQKAGLDFKPQISFLNYTGIRASLPKGDITVENIFELMPFENEMVFVEFKGEQLQEFLDLIASNGGDAVGGIRFVISKNKAKDVVIDGERLVPGNNYWMVTNDYIADGGDNMEVFKRKVAIVKTDVKIRDAFISNLEKRQSREEKLNVELDGRVTNE